MTHMLDNITISGSVVSVLFPTQFIFPSTVVLDKLSDHELQAKVMIVLKKMLGLVTIKKQVTMYWNLNTGEFKVTLN